MGSLKSIVTNAEESYLLGKDTSDVPAGLGIRKALKKMNTSLNSIVDAANTQDSINTQKSNKQQDPKEDVPVYCGCGQVMKKVGRKKRPECPHCSWKRY